MPRTSLSDPILTADIKVGRGTLGITFCPGKTSESMFGAPWDRDLDLDLMRLRSQGFRHVLSLIEDWEMDFLEVPTLGAQVAAHGMVWHHFPIPDLKAPETHDSRAWLRISRALHQALDAGENVVVHCRGGLGRAGTMAALLLMERGETVCDAITLVRGVRPGAIETEVQEEFLQARDNAICGKLKRMRASFFGTAIGDALGAEIEFWDMAQIGQMFPSGVDRLIAHDGQVGAITDDTQMTLFQAEGCIRALIREATKGMCAPEVVIHHAFLRWLVTQGEVPKTEVCTKGLIADRRLYHRRAPGLTCLSALKSADSFGSRARNDSKGCGTIMRVSPLAFFKDKEMVEDLARKSSDLTHGHPAAADASVAWALILFDLIRGRDLEEAAHSASRGVGAEVRAAIKMALSAPRDGRPETVASLGAGWVAEEALAIALYACLCAQTPEEGWRIAVSHGGDSDSTGAIAGAALGILFPDLVMDHPWRRLVECPDLFDRLAIDLHQMLEGAIDPDGPEMDELFGRYPGW